MKNNIIISLLSLCALLAFPGCEKNATDELLPGANLSFRLRVEGPAMTKTTGTDYIDDLETESEISSLDICLISTTSLSNESTVNIISSTDKTTSGQPIMAWKQKSDGEYEVNAIVPESYTGSYYLYVIANRPSWMTNDKIDTYGKLCGSFSGTATEMAACWTNNNFLMINAQDDNTTSGDQAGVIVTMNPTGANKVEPTETVTIERLATKIRVKKNLSMEVAPLLTQVLCSGDNDGDPDIKGAIAAMTLEGYALFNCVNSFNLIQRWSAATGSGSQPQLLVSPSSYIGVQADHSDAYGMKDGIFSEGYYNNIPASLAFCDLGTVFYCMENNSPYYTNLVTGPSDASAGTKMKGRVTGLVFKARTGYAKSFSGEAIVTEPLYVDDNTIGWTTKDGEPNSTNDDIFWTTLYQYKGDYYGDIACLLKNNIAALVDGKGLSSSSTPNELRNAGVKVFEDGYMYYNYWITDPNYTDNGKNYLSVMRNTFYDINITAINSLGDEFPCGGSSYNSSDPISVDVPKLTIWMDIPDWTDKTGNYVIQ